MKRLTACFGAFVIFLMTSGCFVIDGYKVSKPQRIAYRGKRHEEFGPEYHHLTLRSNFTFDVSVSNYENFWEMWFFLNIFPQLDQFPAHSEPLRVHVAIAPTANSKDLAFDPWMTRITTERETNLAPASVSCMSGTDLRNPDFPVSVARPLEFVIVFAGARECPLNVSMPYQFSAAGITLSGDPAPMESIQFKPKIIVRPGFKLPY